MKTSDQIDKLAQALAKAQGAIKNPEKNNTAKIPMKNGGEYSYDYVDLPACFDAAREVLSANELCVVFTLEMMDRTFILEGRLIHSSGQWISSQFPLGAAYEPKALGAAMTYGRRYLFCGLVGIAGEEDTDSLPEGVYKPKEKQSGPKVTIEPKNSNAGDPNDNQGGAIIKPITPKPKEVPASMGYLLTAMKDLKIEANVKAFIKDKYSIESLKSPELTEEKIQEILDWINSPGWESEVAQD